MLRGHEETGEGIIEGMGMRRLATASDMSCNFTDVLLVPSHKFSQFFHSYADHIRQMLYAGAMVHNKCLWDVGGQPAR